VTDGMQTESRGGCVAEVKRGTDDDGAEQLDSGQDVGARWGRVRGQVWGCGRLKPYPWQQGLRRALPIRQRRAALGTMEGTDGGL
jgi:hypothetical protein